MSHNDFGSCVLKTVQKMSTLKEINQMGLLELKPLLKVSEMEVNKIYPIVNLENTDGQFGTQIKVEMEDFFVYLPKRMTLSREVMMSLIKRKLMGLVFRGIRTIWKFEKDTVLVEFVEL